MDEFENIIQDGDSPTIQLANYCVYEIACEFAAHIKELRKLVEYRILHQDAVPQLMAAAVSRKFFTVVNEAGDVEKALEQAKASIGGELTLDDVRQEVARLARESDLGSEPKKDVINGLDTIFGGN